MLDAKLCYRSAHSAHVMPLKVIPALLKCSSLHRRSLGFSIGSHPQATAALVQGNAAMYWLHEASGTIAAKEL